MKYCSNCGAMMEDNVMFCSACGAQLAAAQQPAQQSFQQQSGGYPNPAVPSGPMPNPSVYLVLVVIGFIMGILWGALSIGPYNKMKEAIAANDSVTANANAKKIRTFFIIGLIINVLIFVGRMAQAGAI